MDNSTPPIAAYLAGPRIALRAPVLADADAIATWDDAPLPHTPEAGRELLRRSEQTPWGNAEHIRLMIVDLGGGDTAGSVLVERQHDRIGKIRIISAPLLSEIERMRSIGIGPTDHRPQAVRVTV